MTTVQAPKKRRTSPLLIPAALLSLASLAWTTWSLVDLLGTGLIGVTVAAGADIIWGSVIIAEARGLRIGGKNWVVPTFGWATLLVVAGFLAMHGMVRESLALAAAGPFLPLGAKAVWVLALADMRDPAALTHDELHTLAAMERGMTFEEAQHSIRMRQQRMGAELLMAEVATDFDIEVMRQDRARELNRRRPMELDAGDAPTQKALTIQGSVEKPKEQPPSEPAGPAGEPVDDVLDLFGQSHAPVIYFLRNGSRVKIGVSQNLKRRIEALSLRVHDLMRVEHGAVGHERQLHERFADVRVGNTEWFELRGELAAYLGEPSAEPSEPKAQQSREPVAHASEPKVQETGEPAAHTPETASLATSITTPSMQVATSEPRAQVTQPAARPFGFSAQVTAQSAQRAQAVSKVSELLTQDPGLTSAQVVELLDVSPATAKRYLREARSPRPTN